MNDVFCDNCKKKNYCSCQCRNFKEKDNFTITIVPFKLDNNGKIDITDERFLNTSVNYKGE